MSSLGAYKVKGKKGYQKVSVELEEQDESVERTKLCRVPVSLWTGAEIQSPHWSRALDIHAKLLKLQVGLRGGAD